MNAVNIVITGAVVALSSVCPPTTIGQRDPSAMRIISADVGSELFGRPVLATAAQPTRPSLIMIGNETFSCIPAGDGLKVCLKT